MYYSARLIIHAHAFSLTKIVHTDLNWKKLNTHEMQSRQKRNYSKRRPQNEIHTFLMALYHLIFQLIILQVLPSLFYKCVLACLHLVQECLDVNFIFCLQPNGSVSSGLLCCLLITGYIRFNRGYWAWPQLGCETLSLNLEFPHVQF